MIEIIIAIATWCSNGGIQPPRDCKRDTLACVMKDLKPGDYDNQSYLTKKLLECLKK